MRFSITAFVLSTDSRRPARRLLLVLGMFALAMLANMPAKAGDTVYYYSSDTVHSEVVVTDANRNVVERTYYAPYGMVLNRDLRDGPGFTGHEEDPETGLVYMQQRYYCPECGRFLSVDPVGVDPASGGNFNRYEYAQDNPYRYTDPDGRTVSCDASSCTIEAHSLLEEAADYVYVGAKYAQRLVQIRMAEHSRPTPINNESHQQSPALPKDLVGTSDSKSRQQGGRVNNGPLSPEHGGTGDAEKDFGKLTGGKSAPAPADKGYPEGTRVGENGISIRPATDNSGPRIDIPANGSKPSETLHYPKPPPPPPKLTDGGD